MSIFEQASRQKLRFDTSKGALGVEDLWDLPLTSNTGRVNLDDIARGLNVKIREGADVSFVNGASPSNTTLQLKFDLVLHIIKTKLAETAAARQASENREKKQRIMAIIEQKQAESLSASSIEELQQMLNAL